MTYGLAVQQKEIQLLNYRMAIYKYPRFKISINPQSKKKQGLQPGDIVRRQFIDESTIIYSLMIVLQTGVENKSPYFIGALIEGDVPINGEILDFVRVTNLFDTNRSGAIYLTANDSEAPYVDVIDGMSFEKSLSLPFQKGGECNNPNKDKYFCIGSPYLTEEYSKFTGEVNRVYRITKNKTTVPSGTTIGFKQSIEQPVKNPEKVIISFKIRGSKGITVPLTFGYTTSEETDGTDTIQVTTSWSYQLSIITIEFPEQYQRSLLLDLTKALQTEGDWCEIGELNIVKQSDISSLNGTKTRIGKLKGIVDPAFGNLDGYGTYLQNVYASKNINISGTLSAGDESGSASTFYVGKIHKNCIINSLNGNFTGDVEIVQVLSPVGIGKVFSLKNKVSLNCQTESWAKLHQAKKYCFSVYIQSASSGLVTISQNGEKIDSIEIIADTWSRVHVNFVSNYKTGSPLTIELASTLPNVLFSSAQLEAGNKPSLYQPTDQKVTETEEYGAWFNRGGIGGTIQNPLLKLEEDGSIMSNNGSFLIKHDGSGELASGAIRWNRDKVELGEKVLLKWENLDQETQVNLKGQKGDPGIDANLLDWILDWNNSKTQIDATSVITPKIFAGTKNSNGTISGIAIGSFPIKTINASGNIATEIINGIVGFKNGHKTFSLDSSGNVLIGNDSQFIKYNSANGKIEFGSSVILNWTNAISQAKNEVISSAANDASTKANNAKSEAILSASNDATTKADKAKKEAIDQVTRDTNEKIDKLILDIKDAKTAGTNAQAVADAITQIANTENWSQKLTYISGSGIFTGTLSANIISAIKINASQITAGTIDAARINVSSLKTALITVENIEGLTLNIVHGKVGGWSIDSSSIYSGTKNDTTNGYTSTTGYITIGSNGIRGYKWRLEGNGAGALAGGNISWDKDGNVTFGSSVSLQWSTAATNALNSAKSYADTKKTEAINTAASDATSKSNSALNSAKSYADTKKNEAISSAAIDATTKSDYAKELAQAYAAGRMLYRDPEFYKGNNNLRVYNNSSNSNVTLTRVTDNNAPNTSKYVINIKNTGTSSPGCGGFYYATTCSYKKVFITRIIAKIPVGRNISFATNSIGTGGTNKWLTSTEGTGEWKEYLHKVICGTENFSTTHFFYINGNVGSTTVPVEWNISFVTVIDITASEKFTTTIDSNGIYTDVLNANQITTGILSADRIGANSISASKLIASEIKASIINTEYINSLSCTFGKGTIGGWNISPSNIHSNNGLAYGAGRVNLSLANITKVGDSAQTGNVGYIQGLNITGYKSPYGFRLGVGQICDSVWYQTTAKTNCYGIEFLTGNNSSGSWVTKRIFRLSANSVSGEIDCSIAGWEITPEQIAQRATGLLYSGRWGYIGMSNTTHGTGNIYSGAQVLKGFSIATDTPGTAYHLVLGQMASSGSAIRQNYWGLQLMSHTGIEYFALGFNSSNGAIYNKIAGWAFDNNKLYSGNLQIVASGSISNTANKWALNNDGSGRLANGNIIWDTTGNVTFSSSVKLQWQNDIDKSKSDNYGYRYSKTITINGEHNKYYPVIIKSGDQTVKRDIFVKRSYSELHPAEWNNATHGGDLSLLLRTNFGGWGGANYSWEISVLEEQYNSTFAGAVNCMSNMAFAIFLRGGGTTGATYHIYSNQPIDTAMYNIAGCQICYNSDLIGQTGEYSWNAPAPRTRSNADIEEINTRQIIVNAKNSYVTLRDHPLTKIDSTGVYTGYLSATQINAGTIHADRIAASSITAAKLNVADVQAAIVTVTKINGLSCTFTQGKVGGFTISSTEILSGAHNSTAQNAVYMSSLNSGSGYFYANQKLQGFAITWYKNANAGHIILGQIAATGSTLKTGFMGIQMMTWNNVEYFCLSANTTISGSVEVYNRIAGWAFDNNAIYSGTKATINAYSTSGITLHSGGAISSKSFLIKTDGSAEFKGKLVAPTGSIGGFTIEGNMLYSGDKFGTGVYTGICIQNISTDRKLSVYKGNGNEVKMYQDAGGYGITALQGGNTIFQLGSTNKIGGWSFDRESLYSGDKKPTYDEKSGLCSSGIMFLAKGGIAAQNFCISPDGSGKIGPFSISQLELRANKTVGTNNYDMSLAAQRIVFTGPGGQVLIGNTSGLGGPAVIGINGGDFRHQLGTFYTSDVEMRGNMKCTSNSTLNIQGKVINSVQSRYSVGSNPSITLNGGVNVVNLTGSGNRKKVNLSGGQAVGTWYIIMSESSQGYDILTNGTEMFVRNSTRYRAVQSNGQDSTFIIKVSSSTWLAAHMPINWLGTWKG